MDFSERKKYIVLSSFIGINLNIHYSIIKIHKDCPNENRGYLCRLALAKSLLLHLAEIQRQTGNNWKSCIVEKMREVFRNAFIGGCWQGKLKVG